MIQLCSLSSAYTRLDEIYLIDGISVHASRLGSYARDYRMDEMMLLTYAGKDYVHTNFSDKLLVHFGPGWSQLGRLGMFDRLLDIDLALRCA